MSPIQKRSSILGWWPNKSVAVSNAVALLAFDNANIGA